MSNQNRKNTGRKKGGLGWGIAACVLILLRAIATLGARADSVAGALVFLVLMVGFIALIVALVRMGNRRRQAQAAQTFQAPRPNPAPTQTRSAPARAETARPAPQQSFPAPEAHCVVCENTGEDHFQRDKSRRIAQLNDWLKNGLIDRAEYAALKDRYERNI